MPISNFQPIRLIDLGCLYKFTYFVTNSANPDQLASEEANWSRSTLFAKAGPIRVQKDQGKHFEYRIKISADDVLKYFSNFS